MFLEFDRFRITYQTQLAHVPVSIKERHVKTITNETVAINISFNLESHQFRFKRINRFQRICIGGEDRL